MMILILYVVHAVHHNEKVHDLHEVAFLSIIKISQIKIKIWSFSLWKTWVSLTFFLEHSKFILSWVKISSVWNAVRMAKMCWEKICYVEAVAGIMKCLFYIRTYKKYHDPDKCEWCSRSYFDITPFGDGGVHKKVFAQLCIFNRL